jgi:phospholipid/cholesterol/gamma-HCH transport system ATP-binding protein
VTSIVVTHDMNSAFKVGDRIVMLHEGQLIFDGSPQEIQKSDVPVVRRFVVGEAGDQELAGLRATNATAAAATEGNGQE